MHNGLSDHDILSVTTFIKLVVNKKFSQTVYNYRQANWTKIREDIAYFRDLYLHKNPSSNAVEENWNTFKKCLIQINGRTHTKENFKGKVDVPWMTDKVKRLIKKKDDYTGKPEN